jgi:hypothetical protein
MVVAHPEEMSARRPQLLKIHGCARQAERDRARYGSVLVATKTHIDRWIAAEHGAFQDFLRNLVRQRGAVFVGLSAQDDNLQLEFLRVTGQLGPFLSHDRLVFAKGPPLTEPQLRLLRFVYGDADYAAHQQEIQQASVLPLYAKPLLGALYVACLLRKAELLTGLAHDLSLSQRTQVSDGLAALTGVVCAYFDPLPSSQRWRILADEGSSLVARFVRLYRDQTVPSDSRHYVALRRGNFRELAADPDIDASGDHRLVLLIAVFCLGTERGDWTLVVGTGSGMNGHLTVTSSLTTRRVFIVRQAFGALASLNDAGFVDADDDPDTVVIYTQGVPQVRRSGFPRRLPLGRAPRIPTEVAMQEFLHERGPDVDLALALKEQLGL